MTVAALSRIGQWGALLAAPLAISAIVLQRRTSAVYAQSRPAVSSGPASVGANAARPANRKDSLSSLAAEAGLPIVAKGYRLRSARREQAKHDLQMLYRNGDRSVSVFVAHVAPEAKPSPGWKPLLLRPGQQAFAMERDGRAAVAWSKSGRRYIAIARFSLNDLRRFAEALSNGSR